MVILVFFFFFSSRIENYYNSHCTYILTQEAFIFTSTPFNKEKYKEIVLIYQVIIFKNLGEGAHGVSALIGIRGQILVC